MKVYKAVDNYKNDCCNDNSANKCNKSGHNKHNGSSSCNKNNNNSLVLISDKVKIAESFFNKLFGLIFKKELSDSEGLLLENCNSIHTIGMNYRIDVAFLNKSNEVIAIFYSLKPFRFTPFIKNASKVLELKSGFIKSIPLKVGDKLYFGL